MNSTFVRKSAIADEGSPCVERHVGDGANETCSIAQLPQTLWANHGVAQFHFHIGNNRTEVCIAAALAVAVDRALHMRSSGRNRGQGVGYRKLAIVVTVNAYRQRDLFTYFACN